MIRSCLEADGTAFSTAYRIHRRIKMFLLALLRRRFKSLRYVFFGLLCGSSVYFLTHESSVGKNRFNGDDNSILQESRNLIQIEVIIKTILFIWIDLIHQIT